MKGLRVNAGKTKVIICGTGMGLLQGSGENLCVVCHTGVGNSSIHCNGCKLWVHKKCSGLQQLAWNPDYRCAQCMGNARLIDCRPQSEVQVGPDKLEVVASFCHLCDMLSACGGCEITVTTRVKTAGKKFRELLAVLTSHHVYYKTRGHIYSSCGRSAMLHGSPCQWNLATHQDEPAAQLQGHDQTDLQYQARGCGHGKVKQATGKAWAWGPRPNFERERRLRWFGHMEHSSGSVRTACDIQIDGRLGVGRPKLTWKKLKETDCREWKLTTVDPQERSTQNIC